MDSHLEDASASEGWVAFLGWCIRGVVGEGQGELVEKGQDTGLGLTSLVSAQATTLT